MTDLTISEITPTEVMENGGTYVSLFADFDNSDLGQPWNVYVGPNGDTTDARCLSGIPSAGYLIYPLNNNEMRFYLPTLAVGGPYKLFMRRVDNAREGLLVVALTVVAQHYYSSVFEARSLFPPWYRTGARAMRLLGPLP